MINWTDPKAKPPIPPPLVKRIALGVYLTIVYLLQMRILSLD